LREEGRLWVFENRVLRRIIGPMRDKVTGEWRKILNEELMICAVGVIKSRRIRLAGHVTRMEERRGVYRVLVRKLEGKRQLGKPRRRCENSNKMDVQEVGYGCMDWIGLSQHRDRWRALVNVVMNF
jgi:hypothetical protein